MRAAAKLIKEHIKAIETSHEIYSSGVYLESQEAGMKYPPDTLLALIEGMFAGKNSGVKGASIGQAIMQATRPRVMLAHCSSGCACSCITTSHARYGIRVFQCIYQTTLILFKRGVFEQYFLGTVTTRQGQSPICQLSLKSAPNCASRIFGKCKALITSYTSYYQSSAAFHTV